jgi:hypothetical protein
MAQLLKSNAAKNVTTAGTRVQLTTTDTITSSVIIQAKNSNTGTIYVGDSTVSSTQGLELSPGESIAFTGDNRNEGQADELVLSDIWLDSSVNGEGVQWAYYKKRN